MSFALIILGGIVLPIIMFKRGGRVARILASALPLGMAIVLYAVAGPYGPFMLVLYAVLCLLLGGIVMLIRSVVGSEPVEKPE